MKIKCHFPIILASTSWGRSFALEKAGLTFTVQKPLADEEVFKKKFSTLSIPQQALELGKIKGLDVSQKEKESYIICGDQIMELKGKPYGKPKNSADALNMLIEQSGQKINLHTSVVLMKNGQVLWSYIDTSHIQMRKFTQQEAQIYIDSDPTLIHCTGGLKTEGLGMHLIQKVSGEFYSIVGLPVHPLLTELQQQKIIELSGE